MTPKEFIRRFAPAAFDIEDIYQIPALVTLAQAAWESGWGSHAPGYNFFGYTAPNGYRGQRQLLKTVEYHATPNIKYPVIISVSKLDASKYKYIVRRYYRAYSDPVDSFNDYANLIIKPKYNSAFDYLDDPARFFTVIFNAGYATDPGYYTSVLTIMNMI